MILQIITTFSRWIELCDLKTCFLLSCGNRSMGPHKKLSPIHLTIEYHNYRTFTSFPCSSLQTLQAISNEFCWRDKFHWQVIVDLSTLIDGQWNRNPYQSHPISWGRFPICISNQEDCVAAAHHGLWKWLKISSSGQKGKRKRLFGPFPLISIVSSFGIWQRKTGSRKQLVSCKHSCLWP